MLKTTMLCENEMILSSDYIAAYKTMFKAPRNLIRMLVDLSSIDHNAIRRKQFVKTWSNGNMREVKFDSKDDFGQKPS